MTITFGPFFLCFFITFLLICFLHFILYKSISFSKNMMNFLFVGILVILIRMLLPFNFPFTHSIYSYHILPKIMEFTTEPLAHSGLTVQVLLFGIWICVSSLLLIRFLIQYWEVHQYLSLFYIQNTNEWKWLFKICNSYLKKPIKIAIIDKSISPAIVGLFNPTLILPDIKNFTNEEIKYICMHEISHFKQRHLWISLLMELICCIHWWNPLMKYLKRDYMLFLELSNDFHLIQSSPNFNTIRYAELIIKVAKRITPKNPSCFCSSANFVVRDKPILTTRINYIINSEAPKTSTKMMHSFWGCLIICSAIIFSIFFVPEVSYRQMPSATESDCTEITKDNAFIIKVKTDYRIYVDGKYFATITSIPKELKNIPIYTTGDYHE